MSLVLAIDPGNDLGWALFDGRGTFLNGGVRNPPIDRCGAGLGSPIRHAVIERPQVYRASKSKGDPNDLITLAIGVGQMKEKLESRGVSVTLVLPTTWKGQIPKDVHHARILAALPDEQKVRVVACSAGIAQSIRHNMIDAIGLGLWLFRSEKVSRGK